MIEYNELINQKGYDEMTIEELALCVETQKTIYRNKIKELRNKGTEDYKIAAYIHDLWQDYMIADDVAIADDNGISDEDWEKGLDYYWKDMEEDNPLL